MEYWKEIAEQLLPVVATILMGLGTLLVTVLTKVAHRKFGVEIEEKHQAMLTEWVSKGVGYAEQWALQQVKTTGEIPSGREKLDKALSFVTNHARSVGLDQIARDKVVDLVEAQLGTWYRESLSPPPMTTLPAPEG